MFKIRNSTQLLLVLPTMKRGLRSVKPSLIDPKPQDIGNLKTGESSEPAKKLDLSKYKLSKKAKLGCKPAEEDDEVPKQVISSNDSDPNQSSLKNESEGTVKNKKRKHIKVQSDGDVKVKIPDKWEEVLSNLRKMRSNFDAPVDSMGCHKCSNPAAAPEVIRYQALLALMLSSQTKDPIVHAAMSRLIEHGCTVDQVLDTSDEEFGKLIYPVSFWKTKVKNIKNTTAILKEQFAKDIPNTVEGLCSLPGVGPKMAHLCMKTAWNQLTGIGVDTHVHRICNRLVWVKTKTPEKTQVELEAWLPKDVWEEVNILLVGFGQQICQAVKPKCGDCLNKHLCPFGRQNSKK